MFITVMPSIKIGFHFVLTRWDRETHICVIELSNHWLMFGAMPSSQQKKPHIFVLINPLRAKFFRVNINMYLHFMTFRRTNKTRVVEIPPRVRHGPAYTT